MGRGSPIYKKIVEYFKNNAPQHQIANSSQISSFTVHNIIKSFRETREISVHKGQGRSPLLDARGLWALRQHCITHQHDSVIDITKWAQEYFQKPLSVNTTRCVICRRQLKLYHAKRKPYVNMVQKRHCVLLTKAHLKWTVSKSKSVLWLDESKLAKEERDLPACYQCSVQKPASLMVWGCVSAYGMDSLHFLECFHYECWKVYKGFRATYAPLQMTSISGKALCISAGQSKTTYCSYYNSMAL